MTIYSWIQTGLQLASFAFGFGIIVTKLNYIEKNQQLQANQIETLENKTNGILERLVIVEQSTKSAHHRIDRVKE